MSQIHQFPDRCELMARLREKGETGYKGRELKYRYYHAPVRMCRGQAIARVKFAGDDDVKQICEKHLLYELSDRPTQAECVEELPQKKTAALRESEALDLANYLEIYRAPPSAVGTRPKGPAPPTRRNRHD